MRTALIVLALVLDVLGLGLFAIGALVQPLSSAAALGVGVLTAVILSNIPPLIWALLRPRRATASQTTAGIFE